jgi:pimeloyl-ACP methyl ester carboxylesterase
MGAFTDISFDIISETEMGKEAIRFETKLHYYEKGEGEPLLLVHGMGQSLYTWRQSIDFFADNGFNVIAPDMAGFGYSGHLNIYYTVEEYALVIGAFLDALGVKKTHIAGFSTGALAALEYTATHPKRVGRLVLVSPGGPNDHYPLGLKLMTARLGAFYFKHFFSEAAARSVLANCYFDATQLTDDVLAGYYDPFHNKETRETLVRSMIHFDDAHVRSKLKGIKKQILIFQGLDDRIHPEEVIRMITTPLQHKRFVRLRNCAHFVHEEKPERFNEETLAFLNQEKQPQTNEGWPVVE